MQAHGSEIRRNPPAPACRVPQAADAGSNPADPVPLLSAKGFQVNSRLVVSGLLLQLSGKLIAVWWSLVCCCR